MNTEEILQELKVLHQRWASYQSRNYGPCGEGAEYAEGQTSATHSCAEQIEELINKIENYEPPAHWASEYFDKN